LFLEVMQIVHCLTLSFHNIIIKFEIWMTVCNIYLNQSPLMVEKAFVLINTNDCTNDDLILTQLTYTENSDNFIANICLANVNYVKGASSITSFLIVHYSNYCYQLRESRLRNV
jgi:hypothetical protein